MPGGDLEALEPGLIERGQIRQHRESRRRGRGIANDTPVLDRVHRGGGLVAHQVELAAEEIVHGRTGATVGDRGQLGAERLQEQEPAKVGGRADAGVGVGCRHALLLRPGEQLRDGARRQAGLADDRHRHIGDAADRIEVVDHVVPQVVVERGRGGVGDVPDRQRVAVGRGLRDPGHADGAAGAAQILDQHLLAQSAAHRFPDEAGDRVRRAAGSRGHHDGHRFRRIGRLGERGCKAGEHSGSHHQPAERVLHLGPP